MFESRVCYIGCGRPAVNLPLHAPLSANWVSGKKYLEFVSFVIGGKERIRKGLYTSVQLPLHWVTLLSRKKDGF